MAPPRSKASQDALRAIDPATLHDVFELRAFTGADGVEEYGPVWIKPPAAALRVKVGDPFGSVGNAAKYADYRLGTHRGVPIYAHVLAFAMAHGRWPEEGEQVSHVDRTRPHGRRWNHPDNLTTGSRAVKAA